MLIDLNNLESAVKELGLITEGSAFLEALLSAYNIPNATISRLKVTGNYSVKKGVQIGNQLFFFYTDESHLYAVLNILLRNDKKLFKTRFVIISNSDEILAYDTKTEETLHVLKNKLYKYTSFFFPLIGRIKNDNYDISAVNIKVGEKFAQFYNECLINNPYINKSNLNELVCRILFCCFINSYSLLMNGPEALNIFISNHTCADGSDLCTFLENLFIAMRLENHAGLPLAFENVNFIDARIFKDHIPKLIFSKSIRDLLIEIISFDWSDVDPEILGALIQEILVPDSEIITGNYTATANIQKVIGPLFLDELYTEYENNKNNTFACDKLVNRILNIRIFDPNCGCGNFLLVTYKELKRLVLKIEDSIGNSAHPRCIKIENYFGIDNNAFSCAIARLGFLFVILQENCTSNEKLRNNLNILFNQNIRTANATRIDWTNICDGELETYIIGNPPYKGARKRSDAQNANMDFVFQEYNNYKNLDYAACWFILASKYIAKHNSAFAFVTTNSLTQGEQANILWSKLFEMNVHIRFAHKAFKWKNYSRNTTGVTVVIIGVVCNTDRRRCELYSGSIMTEPIIISPNLLPIADFVEKSKRPISNLPMMIKGNMPYDEGNLLFNKQEKEEAVASDVRILSYLRRIVGSKEFINDIERWCLWIPDTQLEYALEIPLIKERINAVKFSRLSKKDSSARKLAYRPHQFREMHETTKYSLVVPSVSSEHREYIPIGFIDKNTIVSNLAFVIYDCEPWIFGVISSKMHNLWIKSVCGGLETRIRYSNELGYNTFPFPDISENQKKRIRSCVDEIITAREEESDKSLAQMYKKDQISKNLLFAHNLLDNVIENCYKSEPFVDDNERLSYLFFLYREMRYDGKHN